MPWEIKMDGTRPESCAKSLETCIELLREDGVLVDSAQREFTKQRLQIIRKAYREMHNL